MWRSWSTTGRAKPARCRRAPAVRTSVKGATRGEAPPVDLGLGRGEGLAQLDQRVAAEEGGEEQAVRLQRAAHLGERAGEVVGRVQGEDGDGEVEACRPRTAGARRRRRRPGRSRRCGRGGRRGRPGRSAASSGQRAADLGAERRSGASPPPAARPCPRRRRARGSRRRRRPRRSARRRRRSARAWSKMQGRSAHGAPVMGWRRARRQRPAGDGAALAAGGKLAGDGQHRRRPSRQASEGRRRGADRVGRGGVGAAPGRPRPAAAVPRLPRAGGRDGHAVPGLLVAPEADRAALLRAAGHSLRLRSRARRAVGGGDRRPAALRPGARGGGL